MVILFSNRNVNEKSKRIEDEKQYSVKLNFQEKLDEKLRGISEAIQPKVELVWRQGKIALIQVAIEYCHVVL